MITNEGSGGIKCSMDCLKWFGRHDFIITLWFIDKFSSNVREKCEEECTKKDSLVIT